MPPKEEEREKKNTVKKTDEQDENNPINDLLQMSPLNDDELQDYCSFNNVEYCPNFYHTLQTFCIKSILDKPIYNNMVKQYLKFLSKAETPEDIDKINNRYSTVLRYYIDTNKNNIYFITSNYTYSEIPYIFLEMLQKNGIQITEQTMNTQLEEYHKIIS